MAGCGDGGDPRAGSVRGMPGRIGGALSHVVTGEADQGTRGSAETVGRE